ncbi:MAG: hypothetical protein HKN90_04030 [Flavobacteriaceae bacterium]|nr:hypothetical protein [Flavobacteriaceae bacterium]
MQHIPPPSEMIFKNGIRHPLLYLWDAWSFTENDVMHLYCLALSRVKQDGTILKPIERNDFPFHIRHFTSNDDGNSWKDEGCFIAPESNANKYTYRTIWSGSVKPLHNGRKLVAYTGIHGDDKDFQFLQNIVVAISDDGYEIQHRNSEPLSSAQRDWKSIIEKGYFLDEISNLGSTNGEGNGPIMAWRDPFIFFDASKKINLFWSAKVSPKEAAIAHAIIEPKENSFQLTDLLPPIVLPNAQKYTQAELPKIYHDSSKDIYYLMVSTCNRLYEGQSDDEVDKGVRLYTSKNIRGPWDSLGDKILGSEHLFGPTVLKTDFRNNRLLCIAPYTDAANDIKSLTFSSTFYIYLDSLKVEFN